MSKRVRETEEGEEEGWNREGLNDGESDCERGRFFNVLIELIKAVSHVFTFCKHDTLLHAMRLPRRLVKA